MIDLVLEAHRKDLGGGFEVGRVLPSTKRRTVGPFTFLDHFGPVTLPPGQIGIDVRPHPHIGLSTITYLFEGEILHHDNLGYTQPIRPGEVNWMTAGRGIVHSERTPPEVLARGGRFHGLQAWVALPREHEATDPAFHHVEKGALPRWSFDGGHACLVAGDAFGRRSPVPTHSRLFYVHLELEAGARCEPPGDHDERAVYVAAGEVAVGERVLRAGQLAVFDPGARPEIVASERAIVMMLGGAPVGPRILWWNFVASDRASIERAQAAWAAGKMALPPADDGEFIPLPDHPVPPEPVS